jgi:hypothetical protein
MFKERQMLICIWRTLFNRSKEVNFYEKLCFYYIVKRYITLEIFKQYPYKTLISIKKLSNSCHFMTTISHECWFNHTESERYKRVKLFLTTNVSVASDRICNYWSCSLQYYHLLLFLFRIWYMLSFHVLSTTLGQHIFFTFNLIGQN